MAAGEQDVGVHHFAPKPFLSGLSVHPSCMQSGGRRASLVTCLIPMFCYNVKAAEIVLTCILKEFCISALSVYFWSDLLIFITRTRNKKGEKKKKEVLEVQLSSLPVAIPWWCHIACPQSPCVLHSWALRTFFLLQTQSF